VTRTALALAPGGGHDGFVGPGDLAGLTLRADLVVLSACRTAAGEIIAGEGVQGLTAPLLQAGARSIIATQWRVADTSLRRVVEGLYAALARGAPVIDALHAAKLQAMREGAPPGEWAAFVAVGDPMATVSLTLPRAGLVSWTGRGVAAGLLALALLLYGWRSVKRRGAEVA
jgi:hypothetical protein